MNHKTKVLILKMTGVGNAVLRNIRAHNPDWIVFCEKEAAEGMMRPGFPDRVPGNIVNASHWYDGLTLLGKKFRPFNVDISTFKPAIGYPGIEKKYIRELGRIKKSSRSVNGGCPTLIGEFGIPFDMNKGKAYQEYAQGDHSSPPWEKHITALDLMYNALDHLFLNAAHWNYTASNRNDPTIGDGFNQEDLSVFSPDQRHHADDIHSGGRALEGWVRPFARYIQGTPTKMSFSRKKGIFVLQYRADPAVSLPTEIFLPRLQFPKGYNLSTKGADLEASKDEEDNLLRLYAAEGKEISVTITRR